MIIPVTDERKKQLGIEKGNKSEGALKVELWGVASDTETRIMKTEKPINCKHKWGYYVQRGLESVNLFIFIRRQNECFA